MKQYRPKIISCILLLNEIDLLRAKIAYEYDLVDTFIVIEGVKTFSGKSKPLYFKKYRHLINDPSGKIIYFPLYDFPEVIKFTYRGHENKVAHEYRWHLEEYTRNMFKIPLASIGLKAHDIIFMSDVDEFVDIKVLKGSSPRPRELHRFTLFDYRQSIAFPPSPRQFIGPYSIRYDDAKKRNLHLLRVFRLDNMFKEFANHILNWVKAKTQPHVTAIPDSLQARQLLKDEIRRQFEGINCAGLLSKSVNLPDLLRVKLHESSGWHLSCMTGGYSELMSYKVNSFSHAEISQGDLQLDADNSGCDYYEKLQFYLASQSKNYDHENFDVNIPDFIRGQIKELRILLLPETEM